MIASFLHRGLIRFYDKRDRSKIPADMIERIEDILAALDIAAGPQDMSRPSFRLHPLKGDRKGQWAVTVRANWRITFSFEDGHAGNVDFTDYH